MLLSYRQTVDALISLRKKKKISQRKMIKALEISSVTMNRFENDSDYSNLNLLVRYGKVLGVTPYFSIQDNESTKSS